MTIQLPRWHPPGRRCYVGWSLGLALAGWCFVEASGAPLEGEGKSVTAAPAAGAVTNYGPAKLLGKVEDPALHELSGLAPSRRTPGYWWTHNDSGNSAKVFALSGHGQLAATVEVTGAPNHDWEDLAAWTDGQGTSFLFLADTGTPPKRHAGLALLRIPEPAIGKGAATSAAAVVFPFRYPDGVHDCEALVVDPKSGRPYLITKTMNPLEGASVFRFPMPLTPSKEVVLEKLGKTEAKGVGVLAMVTGASASPDGSRLAIRTYTGIFEFRRVAATPWESLFAAERQRVDFPFLLQAEAVSYSADGRSLVTTREGLMAELYQVDPQAEPTANGTKGPKSGGQ